MVRLGFAAAFAALALACSEPAAPPPPPDSSSAPAPTLTEAGEPATLAPLDSGEALQWAASVVRVDNLANQQDSASAKLFGLAGGDPAMNGLYTQIAFFQSAGDGWRVFRIGDFLDYRVLADAPGRVDLEIRESVMDAATTEITSQTRRLIVRWAPGQAAPASITVTPAS